MAGQSGAPLVAVHLPRPRPGPSPRRGTGVPVTVHPSFDLAAVHPDVTDVCVTGTPDREWGDRVVAFVVPRDDAQPTLDQVRAHAGDRLSTVQLPKQVVLVDAIPRTPGGKALRRELRVPE